MTPLPPCVTAVAFDAVGTLIVSDPPAPLVYAGVGAKYGSKLDPRAISLRFRQAYAEQEDRDRLSRFRTSETRERQRWQAIVRHALPDTTNADACFEELFLHFGHPQAWTPVAGAAATVTALARRGFALAIASNCDCRLRKVVDGTPALRPLKDRLVISSEVGWRKPARPFFATLAHRLGTAPAQILYVGDDVSNDVQGAAAAGLRPVLFDPRGRSDVPPARRIRHLTELLPPDEPPPRPQ